MSQYRIADCARADLDEIWTYIAQDDPDQRLTVLVYHVRACKLIALREMLPPPAHLN